MKKFGTWALAIGIFGLVATFSMDTSVQSGSSRVHNIGLMNLQQNLLFVFIAVAIVGVIILVSNKQKPASADPEALDKKQARRTCPFCAERILARAVVCRFCGRDVVPTETTPVEDANSHTISKEPTNFEILCNYLDATEFFILRHIKNKTSKIPELLTWNLVYYY